MSVDQGSDNQCSHSYGGELMLICSIEVEGQ